MFLNIYFYNFRDLISSRSALLNSFRENEYTSYDLRNEEIYQDLCAIDNRSSTSIISEVK